MGGQMCSNCKKGILIRSGSGRKRCTNCGFLVHDSYNRKSQATILFPKKEEEEVKDIGEEIPVLRRAFPKGKGFHTDEYKARKFLYEQSIRSANKSASIQKMLGKLRKKKYSAIKTVEIEGALWDVKTGKPVRDLVLEKAKKEGLEPEKVIEDMIFKKLEKEEIRIERPKRKKGKKSPSSRIAKG